MKFGVIGLGRFGYQLAVGLSRQGAEVLAIDKKDRIVESISSKVTQAICAEVNDEESLVELGMEDLDTAIVTLGESFAESVLITTILKNNLKVRNVVARATNSLRENALKLVGADKVVVIERDMGKKLAKKLTLPMMDLIDITDSFSITQIKTPSYLVGKTVKEMTKENKLKIRFVAVQKTKDVILVGPDYVFLKNDILIFAGNKHALLSLSRM